MKTSLFSLRTVLPWLLLFMVQATHCILHEHNEAFVPDEVLRVTYENVTIGCIERATALANHSSPGPTLRFQENKVIWIRVYNDFEDSNLTMHWHGLSEAAAPFADGTPQASQWPIPAGHFFDYELDLSKVSPGTYFYHSHVGFQTVSVNGPLIIEEAPQDRPYAYADDRIIHMTDVFNRTDQSIEAGLQGDPFVWSGETNAIIFNGVGRSQDAATVAGGPGCGIPTIDVDPGTTYRLRFIGATALTFATLAFEQHPNLTIIEADGSYTKRAEVSFMQFDSGQRFSALFTTKTCQELAAGGGRTQFYMQAESRERPTVTTGYAILNYANTHISCPSLQRQHAPAPLSTCVPPTQAPLQLPPTDLSWLEYTLEPLGPNGFPSAAEVTRRLTVDVQQIVTNYTIWRENGYNWTTTATQVPYLVALYEDETRYLPNYTYAVAHGGIDDHVGAFPARLGEVLEIVWQNTAANPNGGFDVHPFHAHGGHYYDIGAGNGTYDAAANEARLRGYHPVKRDTTMLYRYEAQSTNSTRLGWRAWRIRIQDPGVWMIHCHTLQHMIMGMQTVWVFGNSSDLYKDVPVPDVTGYLTYGGNVYGNDSHSPIVRHWFDKV